MENLDEKIKKAFDWLLLENGDGFLSSQEHCPTRDIFQARLSHMSREMELLESLHIIFPLLSAMIGEIGNNAFDHNLGNWRDERGVYFTYDLSKRFAVIADRGQGVLATLQRVRPDLKNENEAIMLAFTKKISGRAPEKRGNGLKFVELVVREHGLKIDFYSGNGMYIINNGIHEGTSNQTLRGVLAIIFF